MKIPTAAAVKDLSWKKTVNKLTLLRSIQHGSRYLSDLNFPNGGQSAEIFLFVRLTVRFKYI